MNVDEHDQAPSEAPSETSSGSLPDTVSETAVALSTGIPLQIQRSFFKAFGRVFTAGAEWPAKYLEGKGRISAARAKLEVARIDAEAADILSQQKARDVVNRGSAKVAAASFQKEDMAQRATEFHASHILREQSIREDVIEKTANNLNANPSNKDSDTEIDDDWLTAFFKEAVTRSSEEYKDLFSRILAGEIRSPGTFSIGTVQSISRMDQETAKVFQCACNLSLSIVSSTTVRVVSDDFLPIGQNDLAPYGLSYSDFSLLVEQGLLRSELSEHTTVSAEICAAGMAVEIGGTLFVMKRPQEVIQQGHNGSILLQGPSFSTAGKQLRTVVSMKNSDDYIRKLSNWLFTQKVYLFRAQRVDNRFLLTSQVDHD